MEDDLADRLKRRADGIDTWLTEHAPAVKDEQLHTDCDCSEERAYWHYGYMVALRDVLRLLGDGKPLN